VRRHREAPLAQEREEFLLHLHQKGTGRSNLRTYASLLIHIVSLLRLKKLREVRPTEIGIAARSWDRYQGRRGGRGAGPCPAPLFAWIAERWLRFHGKLLLASRPRLAFADELEEYEEFMKSERGFAPVTLLGRLSGTTAFLKWFSKCHHRNLSAISLKDVDKYFAMKTGSWTTKTSHASCAAILRAFFRYAENRGWCAVGIAGGIKGPPIRANYFRSRGPKLERCSATAARNKEDKPRRPARKTDSVAVLTLRTAQR
jgi:hypothetical protein